MKNVNKFKVSLIVMIVVFLLFTGTIFFLPTFLQNETLRYFKELSGLSTLYDVLLSIILGFFSLYITYLLVKIPTAIAEKDNAIALYNKRWSLYESMSKNFNKIKTLKPLVDEDFLMYMQIKEMQKNGAEKKEIDFAIVRLPFANSPEHVLNLLLEFFDSGSEYKDCIASLDSDVQRIKNLSNYSIEELNAMPAEKLNQVKQQLLWDELEKMRLRRKIQITLKKVIADIVARKKFECTEIELLYDLNDSDGELIAALKENLNGLLPGNLLFFNSEINPDYLDEKSYLAREEIVYKFVNICISYEKIYHLTDMMERSLKSQMLDKDSF